MELNVPEQDTGGIGQGEDGGLIGRLGVGSGPSPAVDGGSVESGGPALAARIAELEVSLRDAQRELDAGALERRIDAALAAAGVIDAEVGQVMVAYALERDATLGVEEAVASLKSGKGLLFVSLAGGYAGGAAYAPGNASSGIEEEVAALRENALGSGDRAELLRYMRARRLS